MTLVLKISDVLNVVKNFYFPEKIKKTVKNVIATTRVDPETTLIPTEIKSSIVVFLDCFKSNVKCWRTVVDIDTNKPLPLTTEVRCWNHHHQFSTCPIGLPIRFCKYESSSAIKKTILDKAFTLFKKSLREAKTKTKTSPKEIDDVEDVNKYEFFETVGIFCSFPCVQSFILKNYNVQFKESTSLLELMYYKYFGIKATIPEAPPHELMIEYGGELTEKEWLENMQANMKIVPTMNLQRPYTFSCAQYCIETL